MRTNSTKIFSFYCLKININGTFLLSSPSKCRWKHEARSFFSAWNIHCYIWATYGLISWKAKKIDQWSICYLSRLSAQFPPVRERDKGIVAQENASISFCLFKRKEFHLSLTHFLPVPRRRFVVKFQGLTLLDFYIL